jgi:hypothetical protein
MSQLQILLRQTSSWLYSNNSFVKKWRYKRLKQFLSLVKPPNRARIIDLGGTPYMWELINHDFNVTLVNLPGTIRQTDKVRGYTYVESDATNLISLFDDKSFDIVFSNSVIEHVGDEKKQAAFAAEVHRLANAYWVQTPSNNFPIEVHTGVPFYWQLPHWIRDRLIQSWKTKLPAWTKMIEELRIVSKSSMRQLFPDAKIYVERKLWFEKSYSFYKPFHQ